MDRRRDRRWPRQLEVRFWRRGDYEHPHQAIAANISRTGVFVRTQSVLPSGARLRVEVIHGRESFVAEAVVVRALKTPGHLQSVKPSGMGLRFLQSRELVEELLPGITAHPATEVYQEGFDDSATAAPSAAAATVAAAAAGATSRPPAAPVATPTAAPAATLHDKRLFRISYRSRDQFEQVFERDIATGGVFVPTTSPPPPLDSVVLVEVAVDGSAAPPIRLEARVVHRVEPSSGGGSGNLLVGMGVQFTDPPGAVERLRPLLVV
ncbi:MAG TPA: PilZ domain-containing protein [Thermoanaerobaculia bacterium]|nr:PilZ domain-containing protein [Thermoanaerobaculia bacterium]